MAQTTGCLNKTLRFFATRPISQLSLLGIAFGIGYGLIFREFSPSKDVTRIIGFIGTLFINCLKAIVMVFVILIMTRTPIELKDFIKAKKFSVVVLCYYVCSTLLSSLSALALVSIFNPGKSTKICSISNTLGTRLDRVEISLLDSVLGVFEQALPPNIFLAIVKDNILGILVAFLFIGFTIAKYSDTWNGRLMKGLLDMMYQVVLDILEHLINFTPVGVFSLISGQLSLITENCIFVQLGIYIATVLLANLIHVLVTLPLIFLVFVRKNPYSYIYKFFSASLTAFSTASSAAALPVNLRSAYDAGIDKTVANFVLPMGSTLNMNGASMYFPITVIFIANLEENHIPFLKKVLLCIVSTLITVGSAPVPSGAIVYLVVVSESLGLKFSQSSLSLVWSIDPLMDRIATTTNVTGDSFAVKILEVLSIKMSKREKNKQQK